MKSWSYAAAVCGLAIIVATLRATDSPAQTTFWAENSSADFIRNLALFLPLGLASAASGRRPGRVLFVALLFSTSIEFLQQFIPGRDASVLDVASNTLGAGLGVWLWDTWTRLRRLSQWWAIIAPLLPVIVCLAVGWAAQPAPPGDRAYHDDWTPDLEERYRGRVLGATLGADSLRPWRVYDAGALRPLLLAAIDLRVDMIAGPPPHVRGVLVRLYDESARDIMDLAVEDDNLVWRVYARSAALRFEQPAVRFAHALATVAPGDTLRLQVRRDGRVTCLTIRAVEQCGALRLPESWTLLVSARSVPPGMRPAVGWLWMAILALPTGLLAFGGRAGIVAGLTLAVALAVSPRFTGLGTLAPSDWAAVLAGVAGGVWLRSLSPAEPIERA